MISKMNIYFQIIFMESGSQVKVFIKLKVGSGDYKGLLLVLVESGNQVWIEKLAEKEKVSM